MVSTTIEFEFRGKRFTEAEKGLRAFGQSLEHGLHGSGEAIGRELRVFLEGVAHALAARHGNPWPSGTGSKTLSRRSGRGVKSIPESVNVTGKTLDKVRGSIGGEDYLKTHEYGAVIRAKRAKYLTIPLPAALNSNGTPKKRSAREWSNTFVGESKAGNLLIFQRTPTGIVPLYALKKQVKIPARLGMGRTLDAGLPYFVDRAFDAMLKSMLGKK